MWTIEWVWTPYGLQPVQRWVSFYPQTWAVGSSTYPYASGYPPFSGYYGPGYPGSSEPGITIQIERNT